MFEKTSMFDDEHLLDNVGRINHLAMNDLSLRELESYAPKSGGDGSDKANQDVPFLKILESMDLFSDGSPNKEYKAKEFSLNKATWGTRPPVDTAGQFAYNMKRETMMKKFFISPDTKSKEGSGEKGFWGLKKDVICHRCGEPGHI